MNSVRDYLLNLQQRNSGTFGQYKISSCPQLIERIQQLGFLPETTDKQLNKLIK